MTLAKSDKQREIDLENEEAEATRQGGRPTYTVEVKGTAKHLSIFETSISTPKYRAENGRIIRGIQEYLHENSIDKSVMGDGGSAEAQEIVEQVLLTMIQKENLVKLLEEDGQRDPLILTKQGYVLNGNRRLAAMRQLSSNPKTAKAFQYVKVVLLPQLDESELSAIEMSLQMAIEGKARYNWLDELLVIQKNIKQLNMPLERVRVAMKTKLPTLKEKLLMYELVRDYLIFVDKKDQYFSVIGDEQAFKTLAKGFKKYEKRHDLQAALKEKSFEIILRRPKHKNIHLQITDVIASLPELSKTTNGKSASGSHDANDPLSGITATSPTSIPKPMSDAAFAKQQAEVAAFARQRSVREEQARQLKRAEDALALVNSIDIEAASANSKQVVQVLREIARDSEAKASQVEAGS